jgi:anti-sigma factor ChrR (cupin superfamily)
VGGNGTSHCRKRSFSAWLGGGAWKEPTALENEQIHSFVRADGSGKVVVLAKDQLPSEMSNHARFRGHLVVVVLVKDQPLSKTSIPARIWHWLGGGKEPTALENEHNCSFSRVGVYACRSVVVFPIYLK